MRAVYKYAVPQPGDSIAHEMPRGAEFVHVGLQEHEMFPVQAWFLVDPQEPESEERVLGLAATGQPFEDARYLGTVIHDRSRTVWHLLERASEETT